MRCVAVSSASPTPAPVVVGPRRRRHQGPGLDPYARALRAAGYAVFAFDYRGFGESGGVPRQRISMRNQIADYHAACEAAARQPGVDPTRIILWGVSQSGGRLRGRRVTRRRRRDHRRRPDGERPRRGRHGLPLTPLRRYSRSTTTGWRSSARQRMGKDPVTIPIVARPGEFGALTAPGYYEAATETAGPSWRNEIDATIGTELASYRPAKFAKQITAPMLVQIADLDQGAPHRPRPRRRSRPARRCATTRAITSTSSPGCPGTTGSSDAPSTRSTSCAGTSPYKRPLP